MKQARRGRCCSVLAFWLRLFGLSSFFLFLLGCRLGGLGLFGLGLLLGSLLLLLTKRCFLLSLLNWLLSSLFDLANVLSLTSNTLLLLVGVLGSSGITLVGDVLLTGGIGLQLVDGLNEYVLVLELVTLGRQVQLVVDVLVNLLGVTVLLQKTTQNALSAHPQNADWHTGVAGTLSLTVTKMAA